MFDNIFPTVATLLGKLFPPLYANKKINLLLNFLEKQHNNLITITRKFHWNISARVGQFYQRTAITIQKQK